jgi:hypothetical protein
MLLAVQVCGCLRSCVPPGCQAEQHSHAVSLLLPAASQVYTHLSCHIACCAGVPALSL